MATVDTAVRFNKFNSLKLEHGETSWSQKFEVGLYSAVTVQAQVLCLDGAASGQFIMRWLDEDGKKVIDSTDGFSITNKWAKKTATFEVPEGAVKCIFALKNTDSTKEINVACAMAEAGEIASAFDPSLASQVSLLNAQGLYTGIVSANQVIAGILQSLDGKAYFDLEKPEIVMEGKQADLSITPENPLKLTDKSGKFIGGLGVAGGILGLVAGVLTNDPNMNAYATIGYPAEGGSGISIYEKDRPDVYLGRFGTAFGISLDHQARLWIGNGTYLRDKNNVVRLRIDDYTFLIDKNDVVRLWIDPNGNTFLQNAEYSHAIGVDNTGPYFVKSGAKSYLDTGEVLPDGTDLDDVRGISGSYQLYSSNTYYNSPVTSGSLIVWALPAATVQMFHTSGGDIFSRYRTSTTWRAWRKITTTAV